VRKNLTLKCSFHLTDLAEALPGRVAVVCGGGSGHEPAFAGYVGDGMLVSIL
jgi:dihydroxyacetone kinase